MAQRRDTQDEAWAIYNGSEIAKTIQDGIVLLLSVNPDGLTDDAIGEALSLTHQTVSAERRHCVEKGRVRDSGEKRVKANGRRGILWVVGRDTDEARGEGGSRRVWSRAGAEIYDRAKAGDPIKDKADLSARLDVAAKEARAWADRDGIRRRIINVAALCLLVADMIDGQADAERSAQNMRQRNGAT